EAGVCPASPRKPYDERTRECSWDNHGCIGENRAQRPPTHRRRVRDRVSRWGGGGLCVYVRLSRSYSRLLLRRPPMFTRIQSRVFVARRLALVPSGNPLNSQSVTPADNPSQDNKIELSYHVKAIKRD